MIKALLFIEDSWDNYLTCKGIELVKLCRSEDGDLYWDIARPAEVSYYSASFKEVIEYVKDDLARYPILPFVYRSDDGIDQIHFHPYHLSNIITNGNLSFLPEVLWTS